MAAAVDLVLSSTSSHSSDEDHTDDDDVPPMLLNVDNDSNMEEEEDDDDDEPPILVNVDNVNEDQKNEEEKAPLPPVPVTILTGFLGSGKTTLIQHILRSPDHGYRIAVIENEFSGGLAAASSSDGGGAMAEKEGLSVETIIARDGIEEQNLMDLIELPNGCICCTVKDSLVSTLETLLEHSQDLDYILIEASGMANPGPIASIFWLDDALESRLRLDGVVGCVDARNILMQLRETSSHNHKEDSDGGDEAAQQIAFSDRIICNKIDLISQDNLNAVLEEIRSINPTAPLKTATYSNVGDLKWLLDAKCFDVDRAKDVENAFAALNLQAEISTDDTHHHHHHHHHHHAPCLDTSCNTCPKACDHSDGEPYCGVCTPDVDQANDSINAGTSDLQRYGHIHTSSVGTVALIQMGSVNLKRTHAWLASILWPNQDEDEGVVRSRLEQSLESNITSDGTVTTRVKNGKTMQIFRIKGILSIQHPTENGVVMVENEMLEEQTTLMDGSGRDPRRYIVQAVNDLWEIHAASDSLRWEDEERCCKLVVIGRYLDREALTQGFQDCAS